MFRGRFTQNYKKIDYKNYQKINVGNSELSSFSYNFFIIFFYNFELCDPHIIIRFVFDAAKIGHFFETLVSQKTLKFSLFTEIVLLLIK